MSEYFNKSEYLKVTKKCKNCGGTDRINLRLIVPEAVGGQWEENNVTVLCRACEMALETVLTNEKEAPRRPINFWVGVSLYNHLHNGLKEKYGFQSVGSLVRYLMGKYVDQPDRFDDLDQYQTQGTDIKVNVWVDSSHYDSFKKIVDEKGMTVTDSIKSLIAIYANEAETILKNKNS